MNILGKVVKQTDQCESTTLRNTRHKNDLLSTLPVQKYNVNQLIGRNTSQRLAYYDKQKKCCARSRLTNTRKVYKRSWSCKVTYDVLSNLLWWVLCRWKLAIQGGRLLFTQTQGQRGGVTAVKTHTHPVETHSLATSGSTLRAALVSVSPRWLSSWQPRDLVKAFNNSWYPWGQAQSVCERVCCRWCVCVCVGGCVL